MINFDMLIDVIAQSTHLWSQRRDQEALRLLDNLIVVAKQEGRKKWVVMLTRHAAVLAESKDLSSARRYCEEVLADEPEDALILYILAEVLFRQGANDLAMQKAAKSYSLLAHSANKQDQGLLQVLTKRWPEIKQWQA